MSAMADPLPILLAAPDAFKGTAPAATIAAAMAEAAAASGWDCDLCPLSDGGEGFADVVAQAPDRGRSESEAGAWMETTVTGPLGQPVAARWFRRGPEAVIESAAASGLPLAGGAEGNDPLSATSRGTGELIVAALAAGARRVLVGVGGSATTDGGLGALEVIDQAGGLAGAEVIVACDVQTLFVQAAEIFGPQKGADPDQVAALTGRLHELAATYRARGTDVDSLVGAGAAGGLAGGLAVVGAQLVPGFQVVAAAVDLKARLGPVDLVITGEGRLDSSSWAGKVVGGVRDLARRAGTALLVVAGSVGPGGSARGLEVIDLTGRYGEARSRADPAGCVADAVREALHHLS
jgi:glycerate 2-kinase